MTVVQPTFKFGRVRSETVQHRAWRKGVQDAGIDAWAGLRTMTSKTDDTYELSQREKF